MQLNNLTIDVTPKTSWQCFDLGCRVALANFKRLFGFWIIVTLPIFAIALSVNLFWGFFIFWLCKPWYERGLLYILSAAVFGKQVSIFATIVNLPSQIKPLWFSSITIRRLAPSRSFDMAVAQLENLTGTRRSERLAVLHRTQDNNTSWWTICCVHWELFFCLAILTLLQMLVPTSFNVWDMLNVTSVENSIQNYIFYSAYYIAIALVAPFYVAGGFIAYLNRRVILEGWDIELGFIKWRNAHAQKEALVSKTRSTTSHKLAITIVFLLGNILFNHDVAYAQSSGQSSYQSSDTSTGQVFVESQGASSNTSTDVVNEVITVNEEVLTPRQVIENEQIAETKKQIKDNLQDILAKPPFAQYETITGYRFKGENEEKDQSSDADYTFLPGLIKIIAQSLEIVLWGLFIFVFGYLVFRNWHSIKELFGQGGIKEDIAPLPSFISAVFTENISGDIVALVNQCITEKEYRRALSILVQASLTYLSKEKNIQITNSMTEKECLLAIKSSSNTTIYTYMQNLLSVWMKMAWAHQLPNAHTLQTLCQQYDVNFVQSSIVLSSVEKGDL